MIQGFACAETEKIFNGELARRFPPDIQRTDGGVGLVFGHFDAHTAGGHGVAFHAQGG